MTKAHAVVIGGGVIGCAIAWRLAQRGLRVTLLDRQTPGQEASGAAAGILAPQVEAEGPGPLFDLLLESGRLFRRFVRELAPFGRVGYGTAGTLEVAFEERELGGLRRQRDWQLAGGLEGLEGEIWSVPREKLGGFEKLLSPEALEANLFLAGARVDNRALATVLLLAAGQAGVSYRQDEVQRILLDDSQVTGVQLASGDRIPGEVVVVAAGAWSAQIENLGLSSDAVRPVRGQILSYATRALPYRVIFGAGGYVVPRPPDHLLVGSTMEDVGFDKTTSQEARALLEARGQRLLPFLGDLTPEEHWAGLRPATADGLPALGPTPIAGLHLAVGHLRNGILLAPLTADLIAEAVLGNASAIPAPFAAARLFKA